MSEFPETGRRRRSFIPLLTVVILVGIGLAYWRFSSPAQATFEYETAEVVKGAVTASVAATGVLEATTTVTVGSQVSGPIRDVLVDFNSPVKKGEVLATLDPSEYEAFLGEAMAGFELSQAEVQNAQAKVLTAQSAIAKATALVETARTSTHRAEAQVLGAEASVQSAQAGVQKARAEMENTLNEYRRFETLFKRQLVSASELDTKRTAYRVSSAGYETALANKSQAVATHRQMLASFAGSKNDLTAAEVQLQAATTERSAAQSQVVSQSARSRQVASSVEKARLNIRRTIIRSPISGVVIDKKIEPGQTVQAAFSAPELFRIARDLHEMQVRADVSEADIGRVAVGQKVSFTVDSYPEQKFAGTVKLVRPAPATAPNPSAQNNVVVFGVLISAPNPKLMLKPGMTATVTIETQELKDVLLVPDEALRFIPPNPPDPDEEKKKHDKEKAKESRESKGDKRERDKKKKKIVGKPGTCFVETKEGPERRDLVLGVGDGKVSQVLDGNLKPGERVYTKLLEEKKKNKFRIAL